MHNLSEHIHSQCCPAWNFELPYGSCPRASLANMKPGWEPQGLRTRTVWWKNPLFFWWIYLDKSWCHMFTYEQNPEEFVIISSCLCWFGISRKGSFGVSSWCQARHPDLCDRLQTASLHVLARGTQMVKTSPPIWDLHRCRVSNSIYSAIINQFLGELVYYSIGYTYIIVSPCRVISAFSLAYPCPPCLSSAMLLLATCTKYAQWRRDHPEYPRIWHRKLKNKNSGDFGRFWILALGKRNEILGESLPSR